MITCRITTNNIACTPAKLFIIIKSIQRHKHGYCTLETLNIIINLMLQATSFIKVSWQVLLETLNIKLAIVIYIAK